MARYIPGSIVMVLPIENWNTSDTYPKHMEKFCGKLAVVMNVYEEHNCYQLKGLSDETVSKSDWLNYVFTDDMLERG